MTTTERHPFLGVSRMAWLVVALVAICGLMTGALVVILAQERTDARNQRDTVTGQSQQLVDCVKDPSQPNCRAEAEKVESTIEKLPTVAGPQGPPGPPGVQGPSGTGVQGPRGFIGPIGPRGVPGDDGTNGENGGSGNVGPSGNDGATGPTGQTGPPGPTGPQGAPGKDGTPGRDGTNGRNGTAQPGTYSCPEDQYVAAFTVGEQGGVTLDCRPMPLLPSALR